MHPIQPSNNSSTSNSSNRNNNSGNRSHILRRNRTQRGERIIGEIRNLEDMQHLPTDRREQFIVQILDIVGNPPHRSNSESSLSSASARVRPLQAIPEEGHAADNDDNRSISDMSSLHATNHISGDTISMGNQTGIPTGTQSDSIINQAQIRRNQLSEHYDMDNNSISTNIFDSDSHNSQQPR